MQPKASPAQAVDQAHALLYRMVPREASMMAFADNVWMLEIDFLALIPLMFR